MTDPYADVDPPRARWIWWSLGLYCLSFVVPAGPRGEMFDVGVHLFVGSFLSLLWGIVMLGSGSMGQWETMFLVAGVPWPANPLFWTCLVAWAEDNRRVAILSGSLALAFGIPGVFFGFETPAYWVWLASLAVPPTRLGWQAIRRRRGP